MGIDFCSGTQKPRYEIGKPRHVAWIECSAGLFLEPVLAETNGGRKFRYNCEIGG